MPRRSDHCSPAGTNRPEVLLPGVCPIFLLTLFDLELTNGPHLTKVPQGMPNFVEHLVGDIRRDYERPHPDESRRIDREVVSIRILCERLLDRDAFVIPEACQQLGDGLDRLIVRFYR